MGNTIQKCKLFLALGEEQELQDGYGKIGAYIHRLNRTCRAKGRQLQLIPYGAKEGSFLSGGAAVDVHKEVQDCEIALFLFYRDVPEALKEELQEVYALFQKTNKPKILTFFRLEEGAAAVGVGDRLHEAGPDADAGRAPWFDADGFAVADPGQGAVGGGEWRGDGHGSSFAVLGGMRPRVYAVGAMLLRRDARDAFPVVT